MVHSGRSVTPDGMATIRRESVGIILNAEATALWRAAGEV